MNALRDICVDYDCGLHCGPVLAPRTPCPRCEEARKRLTRELAATEPYYERLERCGGVVVWGDEAEESE